MVFFAVRISLGLTFDLSPECNDGWQSPSIGRAGACSHHGGVDRSKSTNAFLFSLLLGAGSVLGTKILSESRTSANGRRERPTRLNSGDVVEKIEMSDGRLAVEAPKSIQPCPIHGAMGESLDKSMWVCREYPNCEYWFTK